MLTRACVEDSIEAAGRVEAPKRKIKNCIIKKSKVLHIFTPKEVFSWVPDVCNVKATTLNFHVGKLRHTIKHVGNCSSERMDEVHFMNRGRESLWIMKEIH